MIRLDFLPRELINLILSLPIEWVTVILAALPISELRGAIPVALSMNEPIFKTYCLSVVGNLIPIIPLLLLLQPVSAYLRRFRLWRNFFEWLFERTRRRAQIVERYEALGLVLFVAIPLPITGAWTGCVAASLFRIRMRYAVLSISIGVLIAGIIVTAVTLVGKGIWYRLFVV